MKTYEGMFLLDAGQTDFDAACQPIQTVLERNDAEVVQMRKWDERRLAFEVKGRRRGLYVLTYFKAAPDALAGIERDVQLNEGVLRVLILSADHVGTEKMATHTPAEAETARREADAAAIEAAEAAKRATEAAKAAAEPAPEAAELAAEPAPETTETAAEPAPEAAEPADEPAAETTEPAAEPAPETAEPAAEATEAADEPVDEATEAAPQTDEGEDAADEAKPAE